MKFLQSIIKVFLWWSGEEALHFSSLKAKFFKLFLGYKGILAIILRVVVNHGKPFNWNLFVANHVLIERISTVFTNYCISIQQFFQIFYLPLFQMTDRFEPLLPNQNCILITRLLILTEVVWIWCKDAYILGTDYPSIIVIIVGNLSILSVNFFS